MRTKSAQVSAVLANPSHGARPLVTVYSSAGVAGPTWGDAAPAGPVDPVFNVEIEQSIDSFRTARVTLQRQQGRYSLAPLVSTGNPLFVTEAPVAVGRRILIEVELQLGGISVTPSGLRETVFDGFIDEVSWPDDEMQLVCTDKWARLRDTWIETERVYGYAQGAFATKGCLVWRYDMAPLALNELVIPSEKKFNGRFYRVTAVSGAQSSVEPVWPTGGGSTVVSGGVTFTESGAVSDSTGTAIETIIAQVLADNGLGSFVTLQTPVSPGWAIKPYIQQRESVADAIQAMVDQLGWWIRFEWSSSLGRYELHLVQPDRASSTVHKVIAQDEEHECTELAVDVWSIRNVVRVIYGDSTSRDAAGRPTRITREVSDAASITKYGRRFMEVAEADGSNIDTSTEADRLANAILSDLKEPTIGVGVAFPIDPYLELGDRLQIPADNLRFTSAQTLAIESLRHSLSAEGCSTSVTLRGAPAAHRTAWLEFDANTREGDVHQLSLLNANATALSSAAVVGGQRFTVADTRGKGAWAQMHELHVSETAGFTPSAATLRAAGEQSSFDVPSLVPGKTYYWQVVPFTLNADRIVRGSPSTEQSFVAGRAKTGHYDSLSTQSHLPLNGNFEHASDDLAVAPPDHWAVVTRPSESAEVWGSSGSVFHGTDASKGRYIELLANASKRGNLVSSAFEVRRGLRAFNIYLSIMRTGSSAVSGKDLIVDVSLYADSALGTLVRTDTIFLSGSASGPYPSLSTWYDAVIDYGGGYGALPTNANFMVIALRRGTTGDSSFAWRVGDVYVQEADFFRAIIDQQAFIGVTFNTGWQNYTTGFGGAWANVEYMKDSQGFVHLHGLCYRATGVNTVMFTLPAGYRPAGQQIFPVDSNSAHGRVDVKTNGDVELAAGAAGNWVSLSGITFKAA